MTGATSCTHDSDKQDAFNRIELHPSLQVGSSAVEVADTACGFRIVLNMVLPVGTLDLGRFLALVGHTSGRRDGGCPLNAQITPAIKARRLAKCRPGSRM
jgi:hypothetical protein